MVEAINPAFFVSQDAVDFLMDNNLHQISFYDLSQTNNPWEIHFEWFQQIKKQLENFELTLRTSYPNRNMAVLIADNRMFWVLGEKLDEYLAMQNQTVKDVLSGGAFPTWKMTSAELAGGHVDNLRHIILTAAHDEVLLNQLRKPLGGNFSLIHREFAIGEKYVYQMLEYVKKYGPSIALAMKESFVMMERCRVTFEAIQRGEVGLDKLGYSVDELEAVKRILNERCQQEFPAYLKQFDAIHQMMTNAIREGENTQLIRLSRWELALALLEDLPETFIGQAEVITFEREKLETIVRSRELELGPSMLGKQALDLNARAAATKEEKQKQAEPVPEPEPVSVEEVSEPEPEMQEEPKKKYKHRMAFTSRTRR